MLMNLFKFKGGVKVRRGQSSRLAITSSRAR